jgi:uncharacterized membrane protein
VRRNVLGAFFCVSTATLISPDNTWALMAITCAWVAFSIYAEQTWAWAAKLSGMIIALVGALVLTNLHVIPQSAVWFDDIIWGYGVPLAIPLLLMQCDIRKTGRLLVLFFIGALGTCAGACLGWGLLRDQVADLAGVAGMMTGSYIGGSMNFAALSDTFSVPGTLSAAATVADNVLMALYFCVLVAIPSIPFFRKHYRHPHLDQVERVGLGDEGKTPAASFWGKKEISLRDIAINIALSAVIVWVSTETAAFLAGVIPASSVPLKMLRGLLGNKYLIITTLSMAVATLGARQMKKLSGGQEIGTFLIYLFFFAIGVPASLLDIVKNAPLLFGFCAIVVAVNMVFCFLGGKLLRFDLEEIILASNANIGGPTTAVAMAVSKGWVRLAGPIMLVGTLGYVIGTYFGLFIGQLLGA